MPANRALTVRQGQVLLMVGTMKGMFLFASGARRDRWEMGGPHFAGSPVYSLAHDGHHGHRLYSSVDNPFYGTTLRWSDDLGKTWSDGTSSVVKFPEDTGVALKRIWQLTPAGRNGTMYAGVEPTALFVSHDRGEHWSWCADCSSIRTGPSGSRAMAASACTRSCRTPRIPTASWSR